MPGTLTTNAKLESLLNDMLDAGVEALRTLVNHDVKARPCALESTDPEGFLAAIDSPHAVIRGTLSEDYADQALRVVIRGTDAASLSGYMMMSPDDVIEQRREDGTLEGEELETYAEVANILCSSFDAVLRERATGDIGLQSKDHGVITPGLDADDLVGDDELIVFPFILGIAEFPETRAWLLLEPKTAEQWNEQPIAVDASAADGASQIPAAPIRGRLTAYLTDPDILGPLRQSCQRVGLELDRRSRNDVPNPAEHKEGVVLMDVPSGESRRFEWCKRLKLYHSNVKVVLLVHHPSRSRVLQGFLAKADAIIGHPVTEAVLSEKLGGLLDEPEEEE